MRPWDRWSRVVFAVLFCLAVAGLAGGGFWTCAAAQGGDVVGEPLQESAFVPEASHGVTLTVWISEVVTAAALVNARNDALRFDGAGRPGFVYTTLGNAPPTTTVAYFAQKSGATWRVEMVSTGAEDAPTLAFDALDRPHISYVRKRAIYHAWRDGGVWTTEVVNTGTGPVAAAAIAATNAGSGGAGVTGTVGIAFSVPNADPPALYLAELRGGSWPVALVMTGTQEGTWQVSWFVGSLDFVYDSGGRPHIGFGTAVTNMPRPLASLEHTAKIDGAWRRSSVASDMSVGPHALSTGSLLEGFAAYTKFGPPCVIPCQRAYETGVDRIAADGSTGLPIFTFRSDSNHLQGLAAYGGVPQIALESQSKLGTGGEAPTRRELWHVRIGQASTESTLVAVDNFGAAMLAVDSRGVPLIVYTIPSSGQLVAAWPVPQAFAYGQWLPFVGTTE